MENCDQEGLRQGSDHCHCHDADDSVDDDDGDDGGGGDEGDESNEVMIVTT